MEKYCITDEIAVEFEQQVGIVVADNAEAFDLLTNIFEIALGAGWGYYLNDTFYFQLCFITGFLKVTDVDGVNATDTALQIGAIDYIS